MRKAALFFFAGCIIVSCKIEDKSQSETQSTTEKSYQSLQLNDKSATFLYRFAFDCIDQEYPNKLGHVLGNAGYLKEPSELHPAFFGCFDWHSSVHGHWTLLNIIKELPDFKHNNAILEKLQQNISEENILNELNYFDDVHNKNFERTYGWAWLLKVGETLLDWDSAESKKLYQDLNPLIALIENKFIEFLPKLNYPIRVGEHTNTAFALSLAFDYAKKYAPELAHLIIERSKEYYLTDEGCPITWEPGGFDFLSPCLQEASLMMKVLPRAEFITWLDTFLPDFRNDPSRYLKVAVVTDRSDGKLAHLDGLNFSRAWCLYELGNALENEQMLALANKHFEYSYSKMDSGEYAGSHWLASFALYAVLKSR